MKTFYEMMMILEDEQGPELGLGNEKGQESPDQGSDLAQQDSSPVPDQGTSEGKPKNYMFFSNLKAIKGMVEEMLAMDSSRVDSMLTDGHDWASDHISTSRDDVEEVYNWLSGEMGESQEVEDPNASSQS